MQLVLRLPQSIPLSRRPPNTWVPDIWAPGIHFTCLPTSHRLSSSFPQGNWALNKLAILIAEPRIAHVKIPITMNGNNHVRSSDDVGHPIRDWPLGYWALRNKTPCMYGVGDHVSPKHGAYWTLMVGGKNYGWCWMMRGSCLPVIGLDWWSHAIPACLRRWCVGRGHHIFFTGGHDWLIVEARAVSANSMGN